MATAETNAMPKFPAQAKIDALLAARQPKIAVIAMVGTLSTAIARFATSTGMIIPPGDVYEKTLSVLSRASKACGNPSLAARLEHCAHLVNVARTNVSTKLTMDGAELLYTRLLKKEVILFGAFYLIFFFTSDKIISLQHDTRNPSAVGK